MVHVCDNNDCYCCMILKLWLVTGVLYENGVCVVDVVVGVMVVFVGCCCVWWCFQCGCC